MPDWEWNISGLTRLAGGRRGLTRLVTFFLSHRWLLLLRITKLPPRNHLNDCVTSISHLFLKPLVNLNQVKIISKICILTWKRQIFLLWFIISPFLFLLSIRAMTQFPNHFPREKLLRMIIITKGKKRKEKESDSEIASSLLWTAGTKMGKLWIIIIMRNNFSLFRYHFIRAVLHCQIRQVGSKSADNNDWSDSIGTVSVNSEYLVLFSLASGRGTGGGGGAGLRSEDLSEWGVRLNRLTARWAPEKKAARKQKINIAYDFNTFHTTQRQVQTVWNACAGRGVWGAVREASRWLLVRNS